MKKLLSLALCALLLFSFAHAEAAPDLTSMDINALYQLYEDVLAEISHRTIAPASDVAASGSAITFRSLPWGISAPEAIDALAGSGITGRARTTSCASWEFKPDDDSLKTRYSVKDSGWYLYSSNDMTVAGYPIDSVNLYFIHTFDDETVYTTEDRSFFYKAKYTFSAVDKKAAFSMLTTKLSALYGEGTPGEVSTHWWSTGGDYTGISEWVVWYGADNTAAVLEHHYEVLDSDGSIKNESLTLTYGRSDSITLLQELEAAMAREQAEEAASSFDGL